MPDQPEKDLGERPLSLDEAADFLRISKPTMGKLLREGKVRAAKAGRDWRITRAALDEFLAGGPAPQGNRSQDE